MIDTYLSEKYPGCRPNGHAIGDSLYIFHIDRTTLKMWEGVILPWLEHTAKDLNFYFTYMSRDVHTEVIEDLQGNDLPSFSFTTTKEPQEDALPLDPNLVQVRVYLYWLLPYGSKCYTWSNNVIDDKITAKLLCTEAINRIKSIMVARRGKEEAQRRKYEKDRRRRRNGPGEDADDPPF